MDAEDDFHDFISFVGYEFVAFFLRVVRVGGLRLVIRVGRVGWDILRASPGAASPLSSIAIRVLDHMSDCLGLGIMDMRTL